MRDWGNVRRQHNTTNELERTIALAVLHFHSRRAQGIGRHCARFPKPPHASPPPNQHRIAEYDCGTLEGIEIAPLVEGGEIIEKLGDRILRPRVG